MRTPNIKSAGYSPSSVPYESKDIPRFLQDELIRISAAISALADGHIDKSYAAPSKPREGDLRYASGAPNWNPGSGTGVYYYNGTAWVFLG